MWDFVSDYIDIFVGTLVSTVSGLFFVKYILKRQVTKNHLISVFFIIFNSFITVLLCNTDYTFFKMLISCLLFMILFKFSFNLSIHESLLYSVMFIISLTVSEIIVFLILTIILSVGNNFLYNVFAYSFLSNFIVSFVALLILYFNRFWLIKILNLKFKNFLIVYVVLLISCMLFFFYITFSNIGNGLNLVSGLIAIFILLVVIINLFIQIYKNNELIFKYDKLLEFIKKYEVEIDNQRTMRHETKNQLLTIKSKIIDKDNNKNIIDYIDQIIEDNNMGINHTLYAKLNCLPPNGIKGLFYFKVSEAIENDIDIDINISKGISCSVLADLNSIMFNQVGKLFGILLDNAIEASKIAENKKMGIEIYVVDNKVNFIVSNTYIGKINPSIGMFSSSSKGDKRGHGLLLAKFLVSNNDRFTLDTMITDDLYIQKLVIK